MTLRLTGVGVRLALPLLFLSIVAPSGVGAYPTTVNDFRLPGTQPLAVTDAFLPPSSCTPCHSGYGSPDVEPYRNWQGSMMAQAGRDPLMWAALAVANQDLEHSGETCLRCHLPKGWLEGRSVPEDGSAMTADDRHGVQCSVCHRLVDPVAAPENPAEDGAILAALMAPVPRFANAMMVADPLDRRRGPFDVVADLGVNPHQPTAGTLLSPFHRSSDLCGTCHDVFNPAFTRNLSGEYELNALDAPGDVMLAFPEQLTFSEWQASSYAAGGVSAPQFGGNRTVVAECQDCHMRAVTGRAAGTGIVRDDLPLHDMVGGNTFIPEVLPFHPAFGAEVNADILQEGKARAVQLLRKAASLSLSLASGVLTVRVTNESGHKLPTGYPDGRRMWLHVRAFDAQRNVVLESGRYVFATADLVGYEAAPMDVDYDPHLRVWETVHAISPAVAATLGVQPGPSFHLVLNNTIHKDNRIPPRGFTNAAFEAFDGEPVGVTYADGQYWDDVAYPVGPDAVRAEATLYYQTASKEYVEFLRDANVTNAAGTTLFALWEDVDQSTPVAMAHGFYEPDARVVNACRTTIARLQGGFLEAYMKEWGKCYAARAAGLTCDAAGRDARIAKAEVKLRERIGGVKDRKCAARNLTPNTLGHPSHCPVPCAGNTVFDMNELASCAVCTVKAVADDTLESAYGRRPPLLPTAVPSALLSCQKTLAKAASGLASGWTRALTRCEDGNVRSAPPVDCATDPNGDVARATEKSAAKVASCDAYAGIGGCATAGTAAAIETCFEDAIGAVAPGFAGVAYP